MGESVIGKNIARERKKKGWTQRHLAELSGNVTNMTISNVERGVHQPSLRLATQIAQALGVTVDYLQRNGKARRA